MHIRFTGDAKKEVFVRMGCFVGLTLMMKHVEIVLLMNVLSMRKRMARMPFLIPQLRTHYVDCATKTILQREHFFVIGGCTLKVSRNKTMKNKL